MFLFERKQVRCVESRGKRSRISSYTIKTGHKSLISYSTTIENHTMKESSEFFAVWVVQVVKIEFNHFGIYIYI